ncbi:hypothetical protein ACFQWB_01615 [Paenibacillus thermoaerophilus]|uniref:Uncharacterized protein n=1 Tax=Paenibacillus thermoaerophilus TaxID=1215385 RepID=A0ABW2UZF1_9BACL|nr:hypothetical protein [Paenibacillus thermoaerophilus]
MTPAWTMPPDICLPLWRQAAEAADAEGWPEGERLLVTLAADWTAEGRTVVLLKEENPL